ncbi:MAG: immune inhibitor A [Chloroflexota bacterium]|nr:immune inhibitor A [Chloroflexota bacterium]
MKRSTTTVPIIITILLVIALCCLGICLVLFASGAIYYFQQDKIQSTNNANTQSPVIVDQQPTDVDKPIATEETNHPQEPDATLQPADASSIEGAKGNLLTLQQEIIPINDPIFLAERLGGKNNIPETLPDPNTPYRVGDKQEFWVTNVDTNENFEISTTLRYLGENVYIWIENGVDYDQRDLTTLGDTFDDEIYPTDREFFGSEWSPGVDDDPHIYIVYASGLGQSLAGYYSSADQLHPDAHEFSNAHEMFLINSDNVFLWEEYIFGTIAHEFQHMIHWYTDKNEETWLNEGFSMLAELINNFDPGGFDYSYISYPDLQLTDWGTEVGSNGPHYGAAFLFTTYFLDRFGEEATQAVVANDKNGMESIDNVLSDLEIRDPATNEIILAEEFFADWAVTNFLGDPDVADGRYFYSNYPEAPLATPTTSYPTCSSSTSTYDVNQFGVDYIEIYCPGDHTLTFDGSDIESILPIDPYSGDYFFWSNMGDHSNMSLERRFDLTDSSGSVEMTYQTWYDLEEDYDYVFVSASIDGQTWQILNSTSCTYEDPSGNSYGCGLNGQSNGWQQESVDLSNYAGQEVTIRFDYVTDAAVNGVGMVIDDISVTAVDHFADFELDDGGWQGDGFVRIQNVLPQTFRVSLITYGDEIVVTPVVLDQNNIATVSFSIDSEIDSIVLVVSGTTPFTRQNAEYEIIFD